MDSVRILRILTTKDRLDFTQRGDLRGGKVVKLKEQQKMHRSNQRRTAMAKLQLQVKKQSKKKQLKLVAESQWSTTWKLPLSKQS